MPVSVRRTLLSPNTLHLLRSLLPLLCGLSGASEPGLVPKVTEVNAPLVPKVTEVNAPRVPKVTEVNDPGVNDSKETEEEEEEEEYEWTTKVRPAYLKRFEHGLVFGPDYPITERSNATTLYVEPEFKRFCNECEDYWHPKCVHYPHIYDDSKGCVLKTLSPKSLAEMEAEDEEYDDDEYDEDEDDEYEEEEEEEEHPGEEGAQATPRKKPEVLMKAEEIEAMRARINELNEKQRGERQDNNTLADQRRINAVIRDAMAGKFANATTLREEEEEEEGEGGHATAFTPADLVTTTLEPETIAFSMENGPKITIYKELMDDADAVIDMRINNAQLSCPREFVIAQSGIPDVQLGVWTKVALPSGVVMGPFRGRVDLTDSHEDSEDRARPPEHVLHVFHPRTRQMLYQVDGRSNTLGNWCRYINAARHESEQNLEIFFDTGKPFPYFRTIKPVEANTELLAEFGHEFRKGKYTSLVNVFYSRPLLKDLPRRAFPCSRCGLDQGNPIAIQRHRKACNATRVKKTPRPLKKKHRKDETEETSVEVWTPPRHTRPRPARPGSNKKKGKQ